MARWNGASLSRQGLGRAKTSAVAPHVEISPSNCISGSQIILHTRGSMPCWRIVFSTFRGCMSFYTVRVKTGKAQNEHMFSGLPPKADLRSAEIAEACCPHAMWGLACERVQWGHAPRH